MTSREFDLMLNNFHAFAVLNKRVNYLRGVNSIKNYPFYARLNQVFGAHQARKCSSVASTAISLFSTAQNHSVLFSMYTKALIEPDIRWLIWVAPGASAFITIFMVEWSSVVPSRHNPVIFYDYSPNSSLHTVCPSGGDMGNSHEIRVPRRPQNFIIV